MSIASSVCIVIKMRLIRAYAKSLINHTNMKFSDNSCRTLLVSLHFHHLRRKVFTFLLYTGLGAAGEF